VNIRNTVLERIQDDAIQLGSSAGLVEIANNRMEDVGTGVSRHGSGRSIQPRSKFVHHNIIVVGNHLKCRPPAETVFEDWIDNCQYVDAAGVGLNGFAFGMHADDALGTDGDPRYIYHNTIILDSPPGHGSVNWSASTRPEYLSALNTHPQLLLNNVFLQKGEGYLGNAHATPSIHGTTYLDGNWHYRANGSEALYFGEENTPLTDFDRFREASGWEVTGVFGDPMLDNNYRAQAKQGMHGGIDLTKWWLLPGLTTPLPGIERNNYRAYRGHISPY
jgi:hypothetical protein